MKKFDRLSPEQRKLEVQNAALELFNRKGFSATTMENIVEQVSLSKGGVYRIYPSSTAILKDLMLRGMHLRNSYYQQMAEEKVTQGSALDLPFLVKIIGDSLLLYPEFSKVYVEFLWEKRRNPELEELYQQICRQSMEETAKLISACGADELLPMDRLPLLTEVMNAAILSLHTLNLWEPFTENREKLTQLMLDMLKI